MLEPKLETMNKHVSWILAGIVVLLMGLYAFVVISVWSKVIAFTSGVYTGSLAVYILQDYESTYGFLPATSEQIPLKDALRPFIGPQEVPRYGMDIPLLGMLKPKLDNISMWYYHCPPSPLGQVSTLTLTAPIINDHDIEITIRWLREVTRWHHRIVSYGGRKYLVLTTEAYCREIR